MSFSFFENVHIICTASLHFFVIIKFRWDGFQVQILKIVNTIREKVFIANTNSLATDVDESRLCILSGFQG